MIQTKNQEEAPVKAAAVFPPASADVDIDLGKIDIPSSAVMRSRLRKQLQEEIVASSQEQHALGYVMDSRQVRTEVGKLSELLRDRARAMNPFRDFDQVGFSRFNHGRNPLADEYLMPLPILGGLFMGFAAAALAIGQFKLSPALGVPIGVFSMAPLFVPMWIGRTAFNLVCGIAMGLSAPFSYAIARYRDLTKKPGGLKAKDFLADLERSLLSPEQKAEAKTRRIALLKEMIAEQQKALSKMEAIDNGSYRLDHADMDRIAERYLDPKHFTRVK